MPEALQVWLYDTHVASVTGTRAGVVTCRYTPQARERWDLNVPLLSCSLPLRSGRERRAGPFFRGLLPEGDALRAMAAAAGVPVTDTVGMLARFGRDVAGAVTVTAGPPSPGRGSVEPYDERTLEADVLGLAQAPLALYDDSELSLAGLQDKLLLVRTGTGWARPRHGFPSTHILKVEDRRFPGLAGLEAATLGLAAAVGLTTITPELVEIGGIDCLVVDRFDRAPRAAADTAATSAPDGERPDPADRLHQEDVCQALGVDPEGARGRAKYESAGGPSFRDVAGLLDRHGADPLRELERLLAVAVFTVATGNADAHGKNLALLHTSPGVVELAPLYDTVPTALFPSLRDEAAMTVNSRTALRRVTGADLVAEARTWAMDARRARTVVERTASRLRDALDRTGPPPALDDLVRERTTALLDTLEG